MSSLLAFMATSGILGWLNIRGLVISLSVPDEIYDGQETSVVVRVRNVKKSLPSFLLTVSAGDINARFNLVGRDEDESRAVPATFSGRGRRSIVQALVSSPFPINFFIRSIALPVDNQIIIFPSPQPCPAGGSDDPGGSSGEFSSGQRGSDGDLETIADYTGSEPLRSIHWRLSARHQELKVKLMNRSAQEPVILDVSVFPGRSVEEQLRCGCYLINRYFLANRQVGLRIGEEVIPPAQTRGHRLKLLSELALHGQH